MIEVLAHIELVQTDASVGCERDVLYVSEVYLLRFCAGVLQLDVPEPGGLALGQDQGEGAESVFTVAENYRKSLEMLETLAKDLASLIAQ